MFFSFRAMSSGADTTHSGPVSNAGLVTTNLTPASSVPMTGVAAQPLHPIPLLSIPSNSNGHVPTTTPQGVQVSTVSSGDLNNNFQPKIPPLMGIRTDHTLPPPPPVKLPTTVASGGTSQAVTGEVSQKKLGGAPRPGEPPHSQKKVQEMDHEEESEGEDDKGEGDSISQEDLV